MSSTATFRLLPTAQVMVTIHSTGPRARDNRARTAFVEIDQIYEVLEQIKVMFEERVAARESA